MDGKTAILVEGGKIENETWQSSWRWLYVEGQLVDEGECLSVHEILSACLSHNVTQIGIVYDVVGSDWGAFNEHATMWRYQGEEQMFFQGGKGLGEELWGILLTLAQWPVALWERDNNG